MIACVWTGTKYGPEYVERLRNMVKRYSNETELYCLTDRTEVIDDVVMIPVNGLPGWWAKMALFNPDIRHEKCVFFDLDTVIIDSIQPLLDYDGDFAICENFTRLAGNKNWPCKYGSCVMVLPYGFGANIYNQFMANKEQIIEQCGNKGDQYAIEYLHPNAVFLQDVMPEGFFIGYRDFHTHKPDATVCIFAGNNKPNNTKYQWAKEAWQ